VDGVDIVDPEVEMVRTNFEEVLGIACIGRAHALIQHDKWLVGIFAFT
jgi:hypothetical protein